jgi:hypothetical protein
MYELRQNEFEAGRYYPALSPLARSREPHGQPPAKLPRTIEEAVQAAGATGTQSILDMRRVAAHPDDRDFGVVAPVSHDLLLDYFGTIQPTREMIEEDLEIMAEIDRGEGIYFVVYKDGQPAEICFAGYSYD